MRLIFVSIAFFCLSCSTQLKVPDNFLLMDDGLYSGSAPLGTAHFSYLKNHGIMSIISVDAATPKLAMASTFGMKYRHVPLSYNDVPIKSQMALIKAYDELPKPVYIHCHQGRHRSPTAAAFILRNHFSWSRTACLAKMKEAGTSPDYQGLYRAVGLSQLIAKEQWEKVKTLKVAKVKKLAATMTEIDEDWEALTEIAKAGWSHRQEGTYNTLILREAFAELSRFNESHYMHYTKILEQLEGLEKAIEQAPVKELNGRVLSIQQSCKSCHRKFRD